MIDSTFRRKLERGKISGWLASWIFRAALLSNCALFADFSAPEARAETAPEYKYQAVYLYNFLQFVEWPPEAFSAATTNSLAPFVIGVLGKDPFGSVLEEAVQKEIVKGRRVVVKRFERLEDMGVCHLLYISESEKPRLAKIFSKLDKASLLTVGETDDFTKRGGAIKFFVDKERLRFEINLAAVKKARLTVSSQMLKLAKITDAKGAD